MSEPAHHICDQCEAHLYCEGAAGTGPPCAGQNGERCQFYALPFLGIADDDANATDEHDVELMFCDANCANQWLGGQFHRMMAGMGAPVAS